MQTTEHVAELMYLLIGGIVCCLIGTILVFITIRKWMADSDRVAKPANAEMNEDSFYEYHQKLSLMQTDANLQEEDFKESAVEIHHKIRIDGAMNDKNETPQTETTATPRKFRFESVSKSEQYLLIKRKYLMSESKEEEYVKQMMEDAVIIPVYSPVSRHFKIKHKNPFCANIEIVDEDDGTTLPVLPRSSRTNTVITGETINELRNAKIDGYEWITMALCQIDEYEWKSFLDNFKKNKVGYSRNFCFPIFRE